MNIYTDLMQFQLISQWRSSKGAPFEKAKYAYSYIVNRAKIYISFKLFYRVFHANCDIRNRHIFTTVNATWNLKIVSESLFIAIFSWLNLNIANHKLHPMYNQGWTQVKCQNHRILLCFPGPLALHQAAISKRKELQRWDWSHFEAYC